MWYARIIKDTKERKLHIDWNPKVTVKEDMKQAIRALVADPVNICKVVGQQFAHCCFCGLELTQRDSVAVGYGPICAEKWGLPHAGMADQKNLEKRINRLLWRIYESIITGNHCTPEAILQSW
jgi:hypothetical protein